MKSVSIAPCDRHGHESLWPGMLHFTDLRHDHACKSSMKVVRIPQRPSSVLLLMKNSEWNFYWGF